VTLLRVEDLRVRLRRRSADAWPVRGVDLALGEGEACALVGESGSGKSLTCLALLGLLPREAGARASGRVLFQGKDLLTLAPRALRALRGDRVAMVFQDPLTALNPFLPIGLQLAEVLEVHRGTPRREALRAAARALGEVGLPDPEARLAAYPHELSGGMRQRVGIAMALLCRPALLIADEPTTALDVTIQAQVLDLLADLRERHGMALLLVTHDLGIVAGTCERVHVMHAGRVVESAPTRELFARPLHPYTRALLACVPRLDGDPDARLVAIPPGAPADAGCRFAPRCELAGERCRRDEPALSTPPGVGPARRAACFEAERLLRGDAPAPGGRR